MDILDAVQIGLQLWTIYLLRNRTPQKKRAYNLTQYPNLGGMVAPLPEVDPDLEQRMKSYYVNGGAKNFTQTFIVKQFGATQAQALDVKSKWVRDGILKRKNEAADNSPHVLASYDKLRKLTIPSPVSTSPTAKTGEKTGIK